jgi:uncharacterized protein YndB with AHSA1/START domain
MTEQADPPLPIPFQVDRVSASVDAGGRSLTASVDLAADPDRVFRALASDEITGWWVRPGVFDTREFEGDVRPGGPWRCSGIFRGEPYEIEGEYVDVDPPRDLIQTWHPVGAPPAATSTVTYELERMDGGTRVTLTHGPFGSPEAAESNAIGWQTSFERLSEILR